ncbi:MAG: heme ABC transporter permease CcmC [Cellvibrionaceae bacterium]|nr:heme ABC transporter permease CcmC [Cellvibrionaceae bacterium]
MTWQWFHRLGSPRWFYEKTSAWMIYLGAVAVLLLLVGVAWGLLFAPIDSKQGNSYRIIYIHVPAAFLALAGYYVMALAGAIGLIWRMKLAYMVMKSAAPIGAVLTFIALVTGAIWGKPTWGTWWVWDARITSMLLLLFLYLGVVALQSAYQQRDMANKSSAILALVGMINIPIIYKSVDWWFTLHQPATLKLTGASSIDPSMAYPLLVMIVGFYSLYSWLLLLWTRVEILQQEQQTHWVKALYLGELSIDPEEHTR